MILEKLTDSIIQYTGVLYLVQEIDHSQSSHEGFGEDQESPISEEGQLIGKYVKDLTSRRCYAVMMPDENPPALVSKHWDVSPAGFLPGFCWWSDGRLCVVLENFAEDIVIAYSARD